jgi:hypothetical protein
VQQNITLSAGEHPVVDVRLSLGAVSETVTVSEGLPPLAVASPSVGPVFSTAEVENIPLNGRTPMMLDNLALGAISTYEPGPVRPFDNGAPNEILLGGAFSGTNEVLLDGAPNAGFSNQMAYSPPQSAVTEVRVTAFEADASYGHSVGGTVDVVSRSGTNSLHGQTYVYNQTSAVDANSFFNNASRTPRPPYHPNQWIIGNGSIGTSYKALALQQQGFSQTTQMTVTNNNLFNSSYHSLESFTQRSSGGYRVVVGREYLPGPADSVLQSGRPQSLLATLELWNAAANDGDHGAGGRLYREPFRGAAYQPGAVGL